MAIEASVSQIVRIQATQDDRAEEVVADIMPLQILVRESMCTSIAMSTAITAQRSSDPGCRTGTARWFQAVPRTLSGDVNEGSPLMSPQGQLVAPLIAGVVMAPSSTPHW